MNRVSGLEPAGDTWRPSIKHKRATRQARVAEMARLMREGLTYEQIAERLGVCLKTVARYGQSLAGLWRQTMPDDFNEARKLVEARYLEVADQAMQAFERSKQDAVSERTKRRPVAGSEPVEWQAVEVVTDARNQCGDPRHLAVVVSCLDGIRKLYGLDAADRSQAGGPDGRPTTLVQLVMEAERIAASGESPVPIADDAYIERLLAERSPQR